MVPWADGHRDHAGDGWQLFVEVTNDDAVYDRFHIWRIRKTDDHFM